MTTNETSPAATGTDETRMSKHLILLGRIGLPILGLLGLWGTKTVGVILFSVNVKEAAENDPKTTAQMIFVWAAFVVIAILTYRVGVRFKIWSSIITGGRAKRSIPPYPSSERGGGKRFSLGAGKRVNRNPASEASGAWF